MSDTANSSVLSLDRRDAIAADNLHVHILTSLYIGKDEAIFLTLDPRTRRILKGLTVSFPGDVQKGQ